MNEYTDRICGIGLPDDDPKPPVPKDKIDLTIGVFFDGTCNNKYNLNNSANLSKNPEMSSRFLIDGKEYETQVTPPPDKDKNKSYFGTFSNVAELFESYDEKSTPNTAKVYVEGAGTIEPITSADGQIVSSGALDDQPGYAFGKGDKGINSKIERGCKMIVDAIKTMKKGDAKKKATIGTLTLDVFGFSRGAATARSFVNRIEKAPEDGMTDADAALCLSNSHLPPSERARVIEAMTKMISEGKDVNLRKYLNDRSIKIEKIIVRFLGIFDTVSSFAPGSFVDLNFDNDVKELGLSIPKEIKKVVHLVAADEYRLNFSLTSITPSKQAIELILPGAHSDIGGGYNVTEQEKIVMVPAYRGAGEVCRGYMTFDELKSGRWIPFGCERQEVDRYGKIHIARTITHRIINNSYSKIPLNLMGMMSGSEGIKYRKFIYDRSVTIPNNYAIELSKVKSMIDSMISGENKLYKLSKETKKKLFGVISKTHTVITPICNEDEMEMIKSIRCGYIHLSAQNEKALWGTFIEPHKPADRRVRLVLHS